MTRRTTLLACALLVALAVPGSASARVALVATGTPDLAFLDVTSNAISAHVGLPGPSRAVAISRDGQRGFVTAGAEVVAVDVNARTEVARSALAAGAAPIPIPGAGAAPGAVAGPVAEISDLALSPDGTALYVVRGRRLATLDPATLGLRSEVGLNGDGTRFALDESGRTAAVVLANGRVAMVSLARNVLLRHVKLPGAIGVAIDRGGRTLVSAGGRLRTIEPGQRRARKKSLKLPQGAGGGLALSAGGSKLAIGAAPGGVTGALVDLRRGTALRTVAGRGPGWPVWNLDSSRILVADSGAATITLVSPFSRARVATIGVPGTVPLDVVVQPGIATFIGTDGPDTLTGTRGADTIQGLGGNDVLRGGRDRDILDGGAGDDVLSGGSSNDELTGGEGNDALAGGTGNDKILGSGGDDSADGGTGNDEIQGELGNDTLDGGDGDDTIYGGDGNDTIVEKGFGDDKILDGGPGDDLIRGGRGSDKRMYGGPGNDMLYGESGQERIMGGDGNDYIDGGRAGDRLEGEAGDDRIVGDAGPDGLYGGPGNDDLDGGASADRVEGNDGDDVLVGGSAPDILDGGPGDDTIRAADDSADSVYCGSGNDTVYVENTAPTEDVLFDCETVIQIAPEPDTGGVIPNTVRGTPDRDVLYGSNGVDSIFGQGGDDKLIAKGGDDYVDGENGNDVLFGGSGDDVMAGRRGNDVIHGGDGDDRITGDRGQDRIFGDAGNDTINGNFDADVIEGGAGDDRINVVHGGHDVVRCGPGEDTVFADAADAVSKDCEHVRR